MMIGGLRCANLPKGIWLEVLKRDKRAIFTAASRAQRVADSLHGLQYGGHKQAAARAIS